MSPRGLFAKMNFWVRVYLRRGLTRGGFFKVWNFHQRLTDKQNYFLNQLNLSNFSVRVFLKQDIIVQLCFPRIRPWGSGRRGGGYLQNWFLRSGFIRGGLI